MRTVPKSDPVHIAAMFLWTHFGDTLTFPPWLIEVLVSLSHGQAGQ